MRLNQLFGFLILTQLLSAQSFTEASPIPPFDGVELSRIAFADVDGDDDEDVLIAGWNGTARISKLYTNNGKGAFTEMTDTPFEGITRGAVAFADVDGDSDYDVLIAGQIGVAFISKLYTNDGSGTFIEATGTPFEAVNRCSVAFADVDGDNDLDVLIVGQTKLRMSSKLYTNDGSGGFTEKTGTPFQAVENGSVTFADVDGDNDNDVLITGRGSTANISKLYINDGSGNFTVKGDTPFDGVGFSLDVAFADVDGDNDLDVLITGITANPRIRISKLYINDGLGNYSEKTDTPFDGVDTGSSAFADVDGDGDMDVLITGFNKSEAPSTRLYLNDGDGTFTEMSDTPFESVAKSSIAFADVDGDNDNDVLITGLNTSETPISTLYINNGVVSSLDYSTLNFSLDFKPFPNPTTSNTLFLRYHHPTELGEVTVKVYHENGALLRQQSESAVPGQQIFSIDIASLVQGIYFIELDNGKRRGVAKFMVQ